MMVQRLQINLPIQMPEVSPRRFRGKHSVPERGGPRNTQLRCDKCNWPMSDEHWRVLAADLRDLQDACRELLECKQANHEYQAEILEWIAQAVSGRSDR